MVFLTLLRMQLILEGEALDARCFPVERYWTETFLSQMLRRWGIPLHIVWIRLYFPPLTGFHSQNIDIASGYDVIWAGLLSDA